LTNSDPAFSLHGAVLLKAIRTTYNIFLLSKSAHVQMVAQGTVIHMVQNVLGRIPKPSAVEVDSSNSKTAVKLEVNRNFVADSLSETNGQGTADETNQYKVSDDAKHAAHSNDKTKKPGERSKNQSDG
jgi:hypothetical protein